MIRDDGYVKVLDFGIAVLRPQPTPGRIDARRATRGNATLVVIGTPAYMSPEQIDSARRPTHAAICSRSASRCARR